jgi:hypothetical protein
LHSVRLWKGREQDLLIRQARERLLLHAAQKREAQSALFRIRRAVAEFIGSTSMSSRRLVHGVKRPSGIVVTTMTAMTSRSHGAT